MGWSDQVIVTKVGVLETDLLYETGHGSTIVKVRNFAVVIHLTFF